MNNAKRVARPRSSRCGWSRLPLWVLHSPTVEAVVEGFVLKGLRREMKRGSPTRVVQDARDAAAFALLCQKYAGVRRR